MNRIITGLLVALLFLSSNLNADDLTFDSFQAAERAAQQRAQDYESKMKEHLNNVNKKWEQQQRDIGQSGDNPDISNITTSSDGHRSSNNADADKMDQAVQSSLDKLKNQMINSAGPGSSGFAGGSAGYQWRVKKVGDKYVLSDSYSQAAFNTGAKNEGPEASGSNTAAEPQIASRSPGSTPPAKPVAPPATPAAPTSPGSSSSPSSGPRAGSPGSSPSTPPAGSPDATPVSASSGPSSPPSSPPPATPAELAPPQLPPPAVRLVIEHPIDFSEEIFTSNANAGSAANYQLERFSIPEDTRVRLSIELADDIDPNDVSMIIVDEEGARPPVTSSKLNNYRHMFRVPSDDKYSASIFINDPSTPGAPQRKIMQVQIPVTPVDFESRTIDGRNTGRSGATSSSSSMSTPGSGSQARSTFGQPQQVDLSDLYSRPGADSDMSANAAGSAATSQNAANSTSTDGHSQSGGEGQIGQQTAASEGNNQRDRQQMAAANRTGNQSHRQGQNQGAQRQMQPHRGRTSQSGAGRGSSSGANSGASNGSQHSYAHSSTSDGGNRAEATSSATSGGSSAHRTTHSSGRDSSSHDYAHGSDAGVDASANAGAAADFAGLSNDEQAAGYYYDAEGILRDAAGNAITGERVNSRVRRDDLSDIYAAEDMINEDDAFLLAVSVRAPDQNIYQSFNFISDPSPATRAVPAGTELAFSVVLGKNVDPDSISIRVNNGKSEVSGSLNTMGQSFAYSFPQPTYSANLNIKGRSDKGAFNYSIQIPVE